MDHLYFSPALPKQKFFKNEMGGLIAVMHMQLTGTFKTERNDEYQDQKGNERRLPADIRIGKRAGRI